MLGLKLNYLDIYLIIFLIIYADTFSILTAHETWRSMCIVWAALGVLVGLAQLSHSSHAMTGKKLEN